MCGGLAWLCSCLTFFFICVALARKGLCIACTSFFLLLLFYVFKLFISEGWGRVFDASRTQSSTVLWWPSSCSDEHQSRSVRVLSPQSKSCRQLHVSCVKTYVTKGRPIASVLSLSSVALWQRVLNCSELPTQPNLCPASSQSSDSLRKWTQSWVTCV